MIEASFKYPLLLAGAASGDAKSLAARPSTHLIFGLNQQNQGRVKALSGRSSIGGSNAPST
jgi:hypothetical protein